MKGVLVVLMCLAFFANSGCQNFDFKQSGLYMPLRDKSPEQEKQEKRQAWIEEKSAEVASRLGEPYPFMIINSDRKYAIETLPVDKYEKLKAGFTENLREIENDISKESLAQLREKYDVIELLIGVFRGTRAYINNQFEEATYLSSNEDDYYMFHSYPRLEKTPVEAVKEMFYSEHPQYSEYVSWLSDIEKDFKQVSNQISNYGLQKEKEKFLQRARKSGCPEVSEFNFWGNNMALSRGVAYAVSKPHTSKIYDLAGFKVSQSIRNGILLLPDYQDAYRAQPIFVITDKGYPDGFRFNGGDQLVCYSGKMKKYTSVLGSTKTVYQFKAINDSNEYYFLPFKKY